MTHCVLLFFLLLLFIHFFTFGYAEFSPPHGLSLVAVSGGLLSSCGMQASHCGGFSFGGASIGSGCTGFHSCSRAWGQWVWCKGLGAPRHVGSSWISVGTHVSCIGRQILYHWATREVPLSFFVLNTAHEVTWFFFPQEVEPSEDHTRPIQQTPLTTPSLRQASREHPSLARSL